MKKSYYLFYIFYEMCGICDILTLSFSQQVLFTTTVVLSTNFRFLVEP